MAWGKRREEEERGEREEERGKRREGQVALPSAGSAVGSRLDRLGRELAGKDTAVDRRGRDGHGRRWGFRRPWGGFLAVSAGGGGAGVIGGAPTTR